VSPKDVAGVFSRPFIVGHFLPAFFTLAVGALLSTTSALPPGLVGESFAVQLLVIGVAALPFGLLLSNVHAHVVRTFSGEATERQVAEDHLSENGGFAWSSRRRWWLPQRWIGKAWDWVKARLAQLQCNGIASQQRKWDHWRARVDARSSPEVQWRRFDEEFPYDRGTVLPTRLGNAIRSYESYSNSRYGLDGAAVWPRIELLLSTEERALIADARTEVTFFLNCALGTILVALWVALEAVLPGLLSPWWLVLPLDALAATVAFMVFQLLAVTATFRAGAPIRAAVDLHRLELYDRLGVRRPIGPADERELAAAVNALLLRREPLAGPLRAVGRGEPGE